MEPQSDKQVARAEARASAVAILERMHTDDVRVGRDGQFDGAQVVLVVVLAYDGSQVSGSTREDGFQLPLDVVAMRRSVWAEREVLGPETPAPNVTGVIPHPMEDRMMEVAQERKCQRALPELACVNATNDGLELHREAPHLLKRERADGIAPRLVGHVL